MRMDPFHVRSKLCQTSYEYFVELIKIPIGFESLKMIGTLNREICDQVLEAVIRWLVAEVMFGEQEVLNICEKMKAALRDLNHHAYFLW